MKFTQLSILSSLVALFVISTAVSAQVTTGDTSAKIATHKPLQTLMLI